MGIKAKGFFGSAKGGFKLGKSKPKVQGRFIRKKLNSDKNVKFAKKFFKSDRRLQKRYIRRKTNLLKRKAAEKALEGGKAVKTKFKKSMTSKGFNPIKFITAIFVGWIINVLPKIISTLKEWMKKLKPVFDTLKSWVKGVVDFFTMIGNSVGKFLGTITGNNATVDAEKKQIEEKNKQLKGVFDKSKKGIEDLTDKAKGEEKKLKKDIDEVNQKSGSENTESEVKDSRNLGKQTPSIPQLQRDEVKTTIVPYTIKKVPIKNRRGKVISFKKVKIDKETGKEWKGTIKSDLSTITFDGKTYPRGISGPMNTFGGKGGSTYGNLKSDSTTKNRVVTFDVPYTAPKNGGGQGGNSSSSAPVKQSDPDSVNSSELMLNSIEK